MLTKNKIIAVVGPTAGGKTSLSVELAARLGGEVVSCDSMQIYRRMNIGTAKPTAEEMRGIPHHLIDVVDLEKSFSAADYVEAAGIAVEDIISRGAIPVFCGGTGLYLDSFLRGGGLHPAESDPALRDKLAEEAESLGNEEMHRRLAEIDPESAEAIHPNNVRRVLRALEIYYSTGKTKSELDRLSKIPDSKYDPLIIGLRYADREELYRRIDLRVDIMLRDGLLEEVETLYRDGVFEVSPTAAQAIGYKEFIEYIEGRSSLEEAVELLKRSTRRYAKRQMTWFTANPSITWLEVGGGRPFDDIANMAETLCRKHLDN